MRVARHDLLPVGQTEGCRMTNETLCWGKIETRFGTFAAWVYPRGRLVRFWLDAKNAAQI